MAKIYLDTVDRKEALARFLYEVQPFQKFETIPAREALHRITAKPIMARLSLPMYPASAMDGIAVVAAKSFAASDQNPITLEAGKDYVQVDTGDPLPDGFDAVIKVEDLQLLGENTVSIMAPAAPGQYVRPVGEDVVAGDMILPAWHKMNPPDLGAIIASGHSEVEVLAKPKIAILPTGDEMIQLGESMGRGSIIEFNGTVISAYLQEWGAEPILYPIAKDIKEELKRIVSEAVSLYDAVIINAGSSAGRDDYTFAVVEELGKVLIHGVATKPGKPTILGMIKGKPVLGLPGYPVSAYLALDWFGKPLLENMLHQGESLRPRLKVKLGKRVPSSLGSEEFIRLTIGKIKGEYIANPLGRGAGMTMTMVRAHGLLVIPANSLGYEQGEEVEVELYTAPEQLEHNLLATGSHDLALDFLSTALKKYDRNLSLSSSHVGSMGGIMAIRRGEAHIAGIHLLDSATGEYNNSFVQKYFPEGNVVLVHLAWRIQGLMVQAGNPLGIQNMQDIAAKKVAYINRQKGAGTRLLLDWLLQQNELQPQDIYGYEREEYTHLNVAAAIAAGTADVGLGILSAAQAYGLDFIEIAQERYDLLMTKEFYESAEGGMLLQAIRDADYSAEIEALGGYDMRGRAEKVFPV